MRKVKLCRIKKNSVVIQSIRSTGRISWTTWIGEGRQGVSQASLTGRSTEVEVLKVRVGCRM